MASGKMKIVKAMAAANVSFIAGYFKQKHQEIKWKGSQWRVPPKGS
jgi:hypothetical protein